MSILSTPILQPRRRPHPVDDDRLHWMRWGLGITLCLMIGGYFSISESRAITQIYKVITRMGCTGYVWMMYRNLPRRGIRQSMEIIESPILILYLVYLGLGLASFLWTSDIGVSLLQWFMTAESMVFSWLWVAVFLAVGRDRKGVPTDPTEYFAYAITPIALIFYIGSFADPDTFYRGMRGGEELRLGGWLMNPNELGMLCGVGSATLFVAIARKGISLLSAVSMFLNLAVLWLTGSRSSTIGIFAVVGLLVLQSDNKKLKMAALVGMAIAVPIAMKVIIFKEGGGTEEVLSMTGRLPFWTALLNEGFIREPWLGYGFMRINYEDTFQGVHTYPGRMTHNTFMQVVMNLGIVGITICLLQFFATVAATVRRKALSLFLCAVMVPIIINSFTEFGVFGESNYGILFYQLLICIIVLKPKEKLLPADRRRYERAGGRIPHNDWQTRPALRHKNPPTMAQTCIPLPS